MTGDTAIEQALLGEEIGTPTLTVADAVTVNQGDVPRMTLFFEPF
jgi:hypothetical protein